MGFGNLWGFDIFGDSVNFVNFGWRGFWVADLGFGNFDSFVDFVKFVIFVNFVNFVWGGVWVQTRGFGIL